MSKKPRRGLWVSVAVLNVVVGPVLAQGGAPGGRLRSVTAHAVVATNLTKVASSVKPDTTDQIDLSGEAAAEAKHRDMVDKFAAERRNRFAAAALLAAPMEIPAVQGLPIDDESHGVRGFLGISNFSQAAVNQGFSVEPPDQGLAVGNGFTLEAVNSGLAVYSDDGVLLAGVAPITLFFGQSPDTNVSDPRCLYDQATKRWFVTATSYTFDSSGNIATSELLIAVSATADPTGGYAIYVLDTTNDGSDFLTGDCPCLGDQPLLGADANGLYLSTNGFGQTSFEGAQVYMLSKSALAKLLTSIPTVHIDQLSYLLPGVEFSFSVQPSFSPPTDPGEWGTEYFVQSFRAFRLEQQLVVYALGNTSAIDSDPSKLTLGVAVVPSEVYAAPVSASQKAGPTPLAASVATDSTLGPANEQNLDGDDQRMQQVMFAGGKLWTSLGTALTSPGAPVRDGAAWFVIKVKNPSTGLQATMSWQGYVAGPNDAHLLYPAVGVTSTGRAAMVFTLTGEDYFPSAAYWRFEGESIGLLSPGAAPEDGFSAYYDNRPRWGDYSAAAVSLDGTIWIATELIPGGPRKKYANWGTFIARVRTDQDH